VELPEDDIEALRQIQVAFALTCINDGGGSLY
jgi:hypothetical protein